jgi:hypothetical protein
MMSGNQSLINATSATLGLVNAQMDVLRAEATEKGIPVTELKDEKGNYVLLPVLLAKSNCLLAIATLEATRKAR